MPYKRSRYKHIRVKSPKVFKSGSLRTQDIGRKGHSKRVAGKLRTNNRWATQKFMILKEDWGKPSTKRLMSQIRSRHKILKIA